MRSHRVCESWEVRGLIRITHNEASRVRAAVEFLSEGQGISIADYSLCLLDSGDVKVYVPTQWRPHHVTEELARRELAEARQWFKDHLHEFGTLADFLAQGRFVFELIADDGKCAVPLPYQTEPQQLGR